MFVKMPFLEGHFWVLLHFNIEYGFRFFSTKSLSSEPENSILIAALIISSYTTCLGIDFFSFLSFHCCVNICEKDLEINIRIFHGLLLREVVVPEQLHARIHNTW